MRFTVNVGMIREANNRQVSHNSTAATTEVSM